MAIESPVIGWRAWRIARSGHLKSPVEARLWSSPDQVATCWRGHSAPADGCGCGIYVTSNRVVAEYYCQARVGEVRESLPIRITLLLGDIILALIVIGLFFEKWPSLLLVLLCSGGLVTLIVAYTYYRHHLSKTVGGILGMATLSGKVHRRPAEIGARENEIRGERAQIICLMRPESGLKDELASKLRQRFKVPVFDFGQWEEINSYVQSWVIAKV